MANFCQSNLLDAETVGFVTSLLAKSKRLMPKLEYQDKWPNIDGYVYFLEEPIEKYDDCSETLGTFEIQIKKLPKDHNNKFSLETDFLKYSKTSFNPVILLGVDLETEIIYWSLIDKDFIKTFESKLEQKTVTIEFNVSNIITKENQGFVSKWEEIIVDHRNKIIGYDAIKETLDSYETISENSKLIPAKVSKNYVKIHEFLDTINNYVDNDFNVIKRIFFPHTWKLGFAFLDYSQDKLSYSLFNIPLNVNDVQIKQIVLKENIRELMDKGKITSFNWSAKNFIEENPQRVAFDWVKEKIENIFKEKFLFITSSEIISDYLYEFVTHYHNEFGLEIKDEYTIEEINKGFNKHLLIWIEELYKIKNIPIKHIIPVNLDSGFITPTEDEIQKIEQKVQERISSSEFTTNQFVFSKGRYDFSKFIQFLDYAKKNDITKVEKFFLKGSKDMSGRQSYYVWESWTKDELVTNTKALFSILPKIYDEVVKENFPQLFDKLKFFNNFNKYVVILKNAKDEYPGGFSTGPSISTYSVVDIDSDETTIEVYDESENPYTEDYKSFEIKKDSKPYKMKRSSGSVHHDIFHEFPLLNYTYKYLDERLKEYLNTLEENIPEANHNDI